MAGDKAKNKAKDKAKSNSAPRDDGEAPDARELTDEIAKCLKQYARNNPGTAALWCLGIGFVLGWKLKPW